MHAKHCTHLLYCHWVEAVCTSSKLYTVTKPPVYARTERNTNHSAMFDHGILVCLCHVPFVGAGFAGASWIAPKSSKTTHSHPLGPLEGPCAVKITRTRMCRDGWEDDRNLLSTGSSGHVVHVIMSLHLMLLDTKKWKSRNFRTHFGRYGCRRCPAPEVPGQSLHRSGCRCPPCPPWSVGPVQSVRRGERGSGATTVAPAAPQNDVRYCHISIYLHTISFISNCIHWPNSIINWHITRTTVNIFKLRNLSCNNNKLPTELRLRPHGLRTNTIGLSHAGQRQKTSSVFRCL